MWTEGKYEDWWADDNPDPKDINMLTRDPNKVGYSGLECPDDPVEEKQSIVFSAEQYVESSIVVDLPQGYTAEQIDYGNIEYDEDSKPIAVIIMTDGQMFKLGKLSDFSADDRPRVRITDEEWTEDYYDSWG